MTDSTELVPLESRGIVPSRLFGKIPVYNSKDFQRQGVFLLVYGRGGIGKTTFASGAADSEFGKPTLLVEFDRGASVLSHRDDIDVISIHNIQEWRDFLNELSKGSQWLCIIIDPLDELNDMCYEDAKARIHSLDERQHWNASTKDMSKWIRFLRDLTQTAGISIIITAWEEDYVDEVTKSRRNGLTLNPALRRRVEGLVTTIGYYALDNKGTRYLSLGMSNRNSVKFRRSQHDVAQQLPDVIPNPGMKAILDTLIGNKKFVMDSTTKLQISAPTEISEPSEEKKEAN